METITLLVVSVALLCLYFYRKMTAWKSLGIPDSDSGFLGYKQMKRFKKDPNFELFKGDIVKREKYGDVYLTTALFNTTVICWDPEILKQVYIKEFSSFQDRQKILLKIQGDLNNSLIATSGKQWKRIRSTLSPTFSTSKLKHMMPIIERSTNVFMRQIENIVDNKNGVFDPKKTIGRYTMDVIVTSTFGVNYHFQEDEEEKRYMTVMKKEFAKSLFTQPICLLLLILPWMEQVLEKLNYSVYAKEFEKEYHNMFERGFKDHINNPDKDSDILKLMMQAQVKKKDAGKVTKGLTRTEILANGQLMIAAGFETTSTAFTFLVYNLATNPEYQDRLREEIEAAVERHDGELKYETLFDIKYLDMCLNESLRIYPPTPVNARVCERDITIKGYKFLKGMTVQVPVFGLARDPNYWDEPEKYIPDRMEDMSAIDQMIFQPFGGGPRNCIGMRLALIVIKFAVCKLLLSYKVVATDNTIPQPLELVFGQVVASKEEIELKLEKI